MGGGRLGREGGVSSDKENGRDGRGVSFIGGGNGSLSDGGMVGRGLLGRGGGELLETGDGMGWGDKIGGLDDSSSLLRNKGGLDSSLGGISSGGFEPSFAATFDEFIGGGRGGASSSSISNCFLLNLFIATFPILESFREFADEGPGCGPGGDEGRWQSDTELLLLSSGSGELYCSVSSFTDWSRVSFLPVIGLWSVLIALRSGLERGSGARWVAWSSCAWKDFIKFAILLLLGATGGFLSKAGLFGNEGFVVFKGGLGERGGVINLLLNSTESRLGGKFEGFRLDFSSSV